MNHHQQMEPRKILWLMLLLLVSRTTAQFTFRQSWCGDTTGTYAPNSTYQSNLKTVLDSLSSDTRITYGFYNFTSGQPPNRVSSLALCRGDVPVGTCRFCIKNSANLLPQICANQKQAFGYSDYCSLFISNTSIYGHAQIIQGQLGVFESYENFSDPMAFNRSLYSLLDTLQYKAASGNAELKFATGQLNVTVKKGAGSVLYGLVQCTPDLTRSDCIFCIQQCLVYLPNCCTKHAVSPAILINPSCSVRYETYPFYGNVLDSPPPTPPPPPPPLIHSPASTPSPVTRKRPKNSATVIVLIPTAVCLAALVTSTALFILLRRSRRKLSKSWVNFNEDEINTLESLRFSLGVIKHATQGFADNNKLGQGGSGIVYKGVLPDGQEIAVKRLGRNSGDLQFKNEILILAKLQHRNLVKLLGYCLHKQEMLLVYEFMPNRSLDNFIFDPLQRESMVWGTRYKVINGISRGLLYLREESRLRIIHRDLKASNVLLDSNFNPKIADFGMARLFSIDQTRAVASNIAGTFGYMPPEYVFQGQVSMKLDVYSFGVLILEIVSGQRISEFQRNGENPEDLLNFAWNCWRDGTAALNLVDPTLSECLSSTEISQCIHIALLCVQHNPAERPTMSSISLMLRSNSVSLPVPSQPALFTNHNTVKSTPSTSTSTSTGYSVNLVSASTNEFYPR